MKITKILSHPITQIFSFCIILVGSPYFGGPYGYFLYHAVLEGYIYAIIGIIAILITAVPLFITKKRSHYMQAAGAFMMIISLGIFFLNSLKMMTASTIQGILPLLTLLFFCIVIIVVVLKTFSCLKESI